MNLKFVCISINNYKNEDASLTQSLISLRYGGKFGETGVPVGQKTMFSGINIKQKLAVFTYQFN